MVRLISSRESQAGCLTDCFIIQMMMVIVMMMCMMKMVMMVMIHLVRHGGGLKSQAIRLSAKITENKSREGNIKK